MLVRISAPAAVTNDATGKPVTDPKRVKQLDGLTSDDVCSNYFTPGPPLDAVTITGGAVRLAFDKKAKRFRVVTEYRTSRALRKAELAAVVDETTGQWSDGIGENGFPDVEDRLGVSIDLSPPGQGKPTVEQLDDGGKPPKAPDRLSVALFRAIAAGDQDGVKAALAAGAPLGGRNRDGHTPLTAAISGDQSDVALYLIGQGADVGEADGSGSGPLAWAGIRSGWVKHQHVAVATVLLDRGADPNARGDSGATPLMWAANRGSLDLVRLLLARGADPNIKDAQGGHTALMYVQDDRAVADALLAGGADPAIRNASRQTAIDYYLDQAEMDQDDRPDRAEKILALAEYIRAKAGKPKKGRKK